MNQKLLLQSIGSTEPSTFNELCRALGDNCPEDGKEWRELFAFINTAEREGLIEISRTAGDIDSLILTADGVVALKYL